MLDEAYYTVEEVAELFRVTKSAVWKWMREGKLRHVLIGADKRIPKSALAEFVQPAPSPKPKKDFDQKNLAPTPA